MVRIAETLLEREVLDADEVRMVIQNLPLEEKAKPLPREDSGPPEAENPRGKKSVSPPVGPLVDKQREKPAPA